ncbi:hypothetical protein [Rhizobium sp. Nf11,1]|uniref:hypothetical protein n=1 Tax=Rhizobium sp. Nf11,1 TaxID=3404923 RepID=UPI003D33E98D
MRTILLLLSVVLNVWLGVTVVRLERFHYASLLGYCEQYGVENTPVVRLQKEKCLDETETRVSPWWHIYYALTDTIRK